MFPRPSGVKLIASNKPAPASNKLAADDADRDLSREFYEIVNIVLDRSHNTRIISHKNKLARSIGFV